jgi:hypothetical protein
MKCLGCGTPCKCKEPAQYTTWPLEGCLSREGLDALAGAIHTYLVLNIDNPELRNLANNIESALERMPDDLLA